MGVRSDATPAIGFDKGWDWTVGQPRSRSSWTQPLTRIKVVGVGDGGCTWVRRMSKHDVMGVEYIMVNTRTELPEPVVNMAEVVHLGSSASPHWGTGRHSRVSELTVEESEVQLRSALGDAELVLVTAGMGGSTGTRAAPYIGAVAKEMGAFVLGIVTTPFSFEGSRRIAEGIAGVSRLRPSVDNLIVVQSDRLLRFVGQDADVVEAFSKADEVITQGILGVSELLNNQVEGNIDFAEVRTVLSYPGGTLMAVGVGYGQTGAMEAAQEAIACPLLNLSVRSARGILLSLTGGQDLTLDKVDSAGALVAGSVKDKPRMILGTTIDRALEDRVQLTLIATGL